MQYFLSVPLADLYERTAREYFDLSLNIFWPRIILAKNGKKHLKHCNYGSGIKFELASARINRIILFFSDKNWKNILYLLLKAVQWFTIGGMSRSSGLAMGRSEIKVVVFFSNQWSTLTVETFCKWWTTTLDSMTGTWCFPRFYRWKIKLLYLFLHFLILILSTWSARGFTKTWIQFLNFYYRNPIAVSYSTATCLLASILIKAGVVQKYFIFSNLM